MKMTHQDLIDYFEYGLNLTMKYFMYKNYLVLDNIPTGGIGIFSALDKKWTSLPDNIIFNTRADFRKSPFTTLPESLVFRYSVFVSPLITLEVLNVGQSLILDTDHDIRPGTFVGREIISNFEKHEKFQDITIYGYIFGEGILS